MSDHANEAAGRNRLGASERLRPSFHSSCRISSDLRPAKPNTKLAAVVALVGRKSGASIGVLTRATGWKPHTTRAALTRLRKRGYRITCRRTKSGESVYRLGKTAGAGARRGGGARLQDKV